MGVSSYDQSAAHRRLADEYPFESPAGVARLLRDLHTLEIRKYAGDYAAADIAEDLARAVAKAKLTPKQRKVFRMLYVEDRGQEETAQLIGMKQPNVSRMATLICTKIADAFASWGYGGNGGGGSE